LVESGCEMKDIGSIFPLFDKDLLTSLCAADEDVNRIHYSLCREALFDIAQHLDTGNKVVLLPAYTCDTVITPFMELGWTCVYYLVDLQLRIETQSVLDLYNQYHASLIVVHPYYGKDLNKAEIDLLDYLHGKGCKVAVDLTQCVFSSQRLSCVDYYVGSYRKWFAIPDGGYLELADQTEVFDALLEENTDFVSLQRDAMYLRGLYFQTDNEEVKSISRRLNKMAVEMTDYNIAPHKMSEISCALLAKEDKLENQKRRYSNYKYLLDQLEGIKDCRILCDNMDEVNSAPLYFMIYVNDRGDLQRDFAERHIYAPVIWPVVYDDVLIDDTVKYIYDHILAIPIDQRYDEHDMENIVETIKEHYCD